MICPNCSTDNPAAAKFCMSCGTPMALRCPACQTELPANARFCFSCGHQIAAATPADDARLSRVTATAPAPLAEKMRAVRLSGERKVVTAVFADVVGSTALAEQMDPEDWTAVMNGCFDRLTPAVYQYEGSVARLLGDAMLSFFGAPLTHEDDPVRAVHAALDMLEAARQYAEEVRASHGIDFAVRVGINTGPVVVGDVGSDLKYEYTAMGDAVNLAARLQGAAEPMTILISEHTQRFITADFDSQDLGMLDVKGKAEPVRVYQVVGAKAKPGRRRGLEGLHSPMVGREREFQALVEASAATSTSQGRVAIIVGEPGLGKSRLISEWRAAVTGQDGTFGSTTRWAEGHCLSYGQGLAYHLLIDLLRSLLGVTATASEAETHAALTGLTTELFGEGAIEVAPYLAHLLSLQLEGAALERVRLLDPQALQAQYLTALRTLFQTLAAREPLTLVLDDIHWADPSSTDLLIKLLPLTTEVPLLVCCVTRPDRDAPGWRLVTAAQEGQGGPVTELQLAPLTEADSRLLVANLLEIEALPENIRNAILSKAEGNPFFVEEVIRMLIDRNAIVKQGHRWAAVGEIENIVIPDNLQGLLLARIDRLPEDVKRTLRVASVIGRQFSVRVLEHVLSQEGES